MPELPEVETVRRNVSPLLLGNQFTQIEILRPNMAPNADLLKKEAVKSPVKDVTRIGKYLFVHFEHGPTLEIHLRMSGRLGVRKPNEMPLRYERIRFVLQSGELLIFNDPRTLGRAVLHETSTIPVLALLGPDALTVSEEEFLKRLSKRRGVLKALLLNQSFLAGIGNIYADEACFLANIDPRRRTETLTDAERKALYKAVIATLQKGVDNMGTSFSDFADLFGKPGKNQRRLLVYGRKGKPCLICSSALQHATIGQRTTVWCGTCQA
jgi:formamidopyrimidine-DNA glycosylase